MKMNKYQTPSVEIVKCEVAHTLMVSEPQPATSGGSGMPAPKREDVF